jgi:plasmid stabilization system protein ParE
VPARGISLSGPAGRELERAAVQLAENSQAVANDFLDAFVAAADRLREYPEIGPAVGHGARALLLPDYPYRIVYRVTRRGIRVLAIAHTSRRPGYWAGRR